MIKDKIFYQNKAGNVDTLNAKTYRCVSEPWREFVIINFHIQDKLAVLFTVYFFDSCNFSLKKAKAEVQKCDAFKDNTE